MVLGQEGVAITAIVMVFGLVGLALTLLTYFLVQTQRAKAGQEYKALAEEAVRAQRTLAESNQETNHLLTDIERLLREV